MGSPAVGTRFHLHVSLVAFDLGFDKETVPS